jgi:hypothetical protein
MMCRSSLFGMLRVDSDGGVWERAPTGPWASRVAGAGVSAADLGCLEVECGGGQVVGQRQASRLGARDRKTAWSLVRH